MVDRSRILTFDQGKMLLRGAREYYAELAQCEKADFLGDGRIETQGYRFEDGVILFGISSSISQPGMYMDCYGPTKTRISKVESEILHKIGYSGWEDMSKRKENSQD